MNPAFRGKYGPLAGAILGAVFGGWTAWEMHENPLIVRGSVLAGTILMGVAAGFVVWFLDWTQQSQQESPPGDSADQYCCPKCGRRNAPDVAACIKCGQQLSNS